jgi:hypothetical protein
MSPDKLKSAKLPDSGWITGQPPSGGRLEGLGAASPGEKEQDDRSLPSELDPTDWEEDSPASEQSGAEVHAAMDAGLRQPVRSLNGPYYAVVSRDRLSARYVGKGNHAQDVGTVKANRPLPKHQVSRRSEE